MNTTLSTHARKCLKKGLSECTENQQHLFKRMYSPKNLEKSIDQVVDDMPDEKLDWAMQQVEATLLKNRTPGHA